MTIKNPNELFVYMLSAAWYGTERSIQVYQELSQLAQNPDIKDALEARSFICKNVITKIEQCFKLIGAQPVKPTGRILDVFVEDFRKELNEIQTPVGKFIYILGTASTLTHFRIASYEALIAFADRTGYYGVGVLLESCLADKLAFVERNRRMISKFVETKVAEKMAA
jgi:ferritin-like metal-binding protein YciE